MDTLFCIECGKMVHAESGIFGHLKLVPVYYKELNAEFDEIDLCEFPSGYALVAPPPAEPDWIDSVVEQGSNELEVDLDAFVPHETFELMREVVEV